VWKPGVLRGDQLPATVAPDIDVEESEAEVELLRRLPAAEGADTRHQTDVTHDGRP
jgi:hypothetical protein